MKIAPRIGFIGLGIMGRAMALNLLKNGCKVSVYNRTRAKTREFEEAGCYVAAVPRDLSGLCNVIITMVENDAALDEVLEGPEGVFAGNFGGNYLINMSTVSWNFTKKLASRCLKKNVRFLDCPVSGSRPLAENGTLVILAGAEKKDLKEMEPVLLSMGKHIVNPGLPPDGTALKLCMNLIVAQLTTALAESCSLALKTGIRPEHVFETFYNSPALNCGYFRMKEKNILDLEFSPAFSLKNILKDVRFMLEAAKEKNLKLPVTEAVEKTLNEGFKRGYWDEDLTAIMKLYK
ncbi:MAG: hypothetical protein COT17_03960 [Elusimicrobia bacterium CG08_land_8_20_14_0_20_51_18]|nr:MAG: hypothetical protein COT17_03960 [Elusimicrobia bacterium CG08_land_8_20_14_0_20_51_18]